MERIGHMSNKKAAPRTATCHHRSVLRGAGKYKYVELCHPESNLIARDGGVVVCAWNVDKKLPELLTTLTIVEQKRNEQTGAFPSVRVLER
jgi:hypothetical protein